MKRIKQWLAGLTAKVTPKRKAPTAKSTSFEYLGFTVERLHAPNGLFKHCMTKVKDGSQIKWVRGYTDADICAKIKQLVKEGATVAPLI